jgi:hypothetical protein
MKVSGRLRDIYHIYGTTPHYSTTTYMIRPIQPAPQGTRNLRACRRAAGRVVRSANISELGQAWRNRLPGQQHRCHAIFTLDQASVKLNSILLIYPSKTSSTRYQYHRQCYCHVALAKWYNSTPALLVAEHLRKFGRTQCRTAYNL